MKNTFSTGLKTRKNKIKRHCNICNKFFLQKYPLERICTKCKEESELYHFSEWMNDVALETKFDIDVNEELNKSA